MRHAARLRWLDREPGRRAATSAADGMTLHLEPYVHPFIPLLRSGETRAGNGACAVIVRSTGVTSSSVPDVRDDQRSQSWDR